MEENEILKVQIEAQKKIIGDLIGKYPRRVWDCKKRGTTSVEMVDGSVVIVRKRKGEKDDIYTAVAYAIAKNLIGSQKFNELVKNAKHYEPKH